MEVPATRSRFSKRVKLVLGATLLFLAVVPSIAAALTVTTETAQPNGLAQTGIVGGKPTRFTWEARSDDKESVSEVTFDFPKGTEFYKSSGEATILEGLNKQSVTTDITFSDSKATVKLSPSIPGKTLFRVTIEGVEFPAKGGSYQISGTYVTDGDTKTLPPGPTIKIAKASLSERIISSLDRAGWVQKWNEVPILNMFLKPQLIIAGLKTQFTGWLRALGLVAIGFPLAIPIGLLFTFLKISKFAPFRWIAALYINVIRGTPLFLQIYIAFFGLPLVGLHVNDYLLGVLVLAGNSSAYLAEIFRAGIQSIARGQFEAASSLGMSRSKTMIYVIIPQTIRRVLPTMTSEFILLYKDTSLLAAVGVMELMMFSKTLVAVTGNVTPYIVAAFYYLIVTLPLIRFVKWFETRLAASEGNQTPSDKPKRRFLGRLRRKSEQEIALPEAVRE